MDPKQSNPQERIPPQRITKQIIVIWVDNNIKSNDSDTNNTLDKLLKIVDDVELIDTPARCVEMLNNFKPTKCYVITSGTFGKDLAPQIHASEHLEAIFIFCKSKTYHEKWASEWPKIRGVYTQIDPICDQLKPIIRQVKNDDIAMSIITSENDDQTDLKQLPPSFLYTSMLKDVFFIMKFKAEHFNKMINKLLSKYKGNSDEIELINEFAKSYRPEKAIWWYTRQCFTYADVNVSLRLLHADMIVDMAPFIVDLNIQIQQLNKEEMNMSERKSLTVYRGQGMAEETFHKLNKSKDGLLSFDCFLSTSKLRHVSMVFAKGGAVRDKHVGVLFVINIDPSVHVVPFAHIKEHSYYPDEDEVLFAMHSIFKIGQIQPLSDYNNIFEVQIQLTDEDDPKLLGLKKHMADQKGSHAEHRLGWTLLDMGEYTKAEEVYLELLEKETNERSKGLWNQCLGLVKDEQDKYEQAIEYYLKALEIYRGILSEKDPEIAKTYNNIGTAYENMGKYSEALENYTRAVRIQEKVLPEYHADLATLYNNIGSVYNQMGDYKKVITNYEKSLEISKKILPENHPDIAMIYNNMGALFYNMEEYERAMEYFEKARRIYIISLPSTHPEIKKTNDWIEVVKRVMN